MCLRGTPSILIPGLGCELVERLAWHVPVSTFHSVDPHDEVMTLVRGQRQKAVFQLG
jgi:hypothetical protein